MQSRKKSFIISIAMLILGMTIGFAFLAFAYTGPLWIEIAVGVICIAVLFFLARFSIRYLKSLDR